MCNVQGVFEKLTAVSLEAGRGFQTPADLFPVFGGDSEMSDSPNHPLCSLVPQITDFSLPASASSSMPPALKSNPSLQFWDAHCQGGTRLGKHPSCILLPQIRPGS